MTRAEWRKLTPIERVHAVMEEMAEKRREHGTGYPPAYEIRRGYVIHADIHYDGQPTLEIVPIREWLRNNDMWVTEWFDEQLGIKESA